MTSSEFQNIAHTIPHKPGVYKYFDEEETIIYVGKAKDLRKRVGSYFSRSVEHYKTKKLVEKIRRIEVTIVDTEQDAFLLENSLIKQYQPRYNINLKDDKTYPYIVIKNEPFPRVYLTRRVVKDGSEYYGPYTSVRTVRDLLEFIRTYIPLRTCSLRLTDRNIYGNKFKVCLEYHLGNCKGPCEGYQTAEEYEKNLDQVRNILKGHLSPVLNLLKAEMKEHAEKLEFEKAEIVRKKIESFKEYRAKSTVVSSRMGDVDVFSILKDNKKAYVNFLQVRHGSIIQSKTSIFECKLDETEEEILPQAIVQIREKLHSFAKLLVIPFEISFPEEEISLRVPKVGDKKKLLDLSQKNTQYFYDEMQKKKALNLEQKKKKDPQQVLFALQEDLQLPVLPKHIECFDNSNFQGSYPVAACVVFKNGVPSKKDYRHFNIKTVKGIDDFASMKEAVYRRYKRLLDEKKSLPQLVIIDGGKGQLGAAMEAVRELELTGSMTLVGLAKREEELFFPGDSDSLKLPYSGESMKLIRFIRDQVHRFGVTFHRQKRSKGTFKNELEQIDGIGKKTAEQLLTRFRSIKKIRKLTQRELTGEIGRSRAGVVWRYFHEET
ncbi:MAG TPA: excinuclease ABC subunit UvrC [Chitinophagaceae bacterium]|nr:excinuclease ABC subunit UvrC [Chitinophagaceae bacterium]